MTSSYHKEKSFKKRRKNENGQIQLNLWFDRVRQTEGGFWTQWIWWFGMPDQERLKRMFALQKGTEYRLTVEMSHPGISRIPCPVRLKFHLRMTWRFWWFHVWINSSNPNDQNVQLMPLRDLSDNSIIKYIQLGKWDTTKYTVHQASRSVLFVNEILLLRCFKFFERIQTP